MENVKTLNNRIIDRRDDEDYPYRKGLSRFSKFVRFYSIPVVSVALFFLIIILGIVPRVMNMFDIIEEVNELKADSQRLDERIEKLDELKNDHPRKLIILNKLNSIIPSEQSEVVVFREKVSTTAQDQGLEVNNRKAGEILIDQGDANQNNTPTQDQRVNEFGLIEIPSNFEFKGDFEEFRAFLKELYNGEDFFIVNQMDLSSVTTDVQTLGWSGEFEIVKYQFPTQTRNTDYSQVSEFSQPDQEVVVFIEENFVDNNL